MPSDAMPIHAMPSFDLAQSRAAPVHADLPAHLAALLRPVAPDDARRIVVAMSGGVDSSVVAALLHAQGHEVIGITLQLYDHGAAIHKAGACCAGQDIHDARRVAEQFAFPHYVLDYESRFRDSVIDTFADSYLNGETPVPCITCNQEVKFRDLLATARDLGADALATGHYISRIETPHGPQLRRAHDAHRDQSYFLFGTTRAQLGDLWFPLGDLPKDDVRALARHFGLIVADKADSQDICFVPNGRYAETIAKLKPNAAQPGAIVHLDGRALGTHGGVINFTVGQRRGLGIATGEPLFVVSINADAREVIVGPKSALQTTVITLRDVNWLGDTDLDAAAAADMPVFARVRSTQEPALAELGRDPSGAITVTLHEPADGIARGQACVLYTDGSPRARILGGGWIAATDLDRTVARKLTLIGDKPNAPAP
ncbi:MAG: tRNA 2-thiouridine(34) synthase MnmA [Pseudomonadota bacterium]